MKSDLREVEVGDKIWTIQDGWIEVTSIERDVNYQILTHRNSYTIDGKILKHHKYPTAFLEYPFKEQPIEKDTLVWFRDSEDENWMVGYYSHFDSRYKKHRCFDYSKKSTETSVNTDWEIVTTENPLL
jgi:hypothetical protein